MIVLHVSKGITDGVSDSFGQIVLLEMQHLHIINWGYKDGLL